MRLTLLLWFLLLLALGLIALISMPAQCAPAPLPVEAAKRRVPLPAEVTVGRPLTVVVSVPDAKFWAGVRKDQPISTHLEVSLPEGGMMRVFVGKGVTAVTPWTDERCSGSFARFSEDPRSKYALPVRSAQRKYLNPRLRSATLTFVLLAPKPDAAPVIPYVATVHSVRVGLAADLNKLDE